MRYVPAEFWGNLGGVAALIYAIVKSIAYLSKHFGLRPADRRLAERDRLTEAEGDISRLRAENVESRQRIDALEEELRAERRKTDQLERLLIMQGFRKNGDDQWERPR